MYFLVLGAIEKMIINENYFQFDRKTTLIFKNENRKSFSGFKLFIFASTFVGICHRQALEFVSSPNLSPKILEFWCLIAKIWRH
jgi:hypothetical protein